MALHRAYQLGSAGFALLERAFPSMEAAWRASASELRAAGLDAPAVKGVLAKQRETTPEAEMERLAAAGVLAYPKPDPRYPSRLREIPDAPPVIYLKGSWEPEDDWSVAVVGTRRATTYGREATMELVGQIAPHRVTIVSGLARGIDTVAHHAALDAGGRTIAVLANGLDTLYPPENRGLADRIVEHGALISDYPLGTNPQANFFPRRNRILSGLALGTIVVEGDYKSGAMITARFAMEQNREVFAVPGSIFSPQSRGPLSLIRDGATPVTRAEDVLEALNLTQLGAQLDFSRAVPPASEEERAVIGALTREPRHIDEVVRESGLAAATVSGTLAMLELKGLARDVGGMQYVRLREDVTDYDPDSTAHEHVHAGERATK
ncbi:MAG: DNA protecting protein DprA [SAR202 cluster bacterium Casp-Chloro-G1]|nr:MAG: DNA protecting protein DprA [SAR202 cluster bacterium Casp-Chloro-G1]